ncbi:hypothetical protein PTW35_07465 [Photobacterium sp. DA100]|uniref:hypothetical protein n=1 Tax=Photobacterium sp. DA100 TaxID=3027472 RepID=UPI00247A8F45|nr:hypothetical protein [Photobacterium sp. DA100]WEM43613.1 hypothetical protein PTW35_07465 [Photobacterium sp. DA100]
MLGVSPQSFIAVEDSVTGLLAAKAAQMKRVAVPDAVYANGPRWSTANRKLNSLPEVNKQLIATI